MVMPCRITDEVIPDNTVDTSSLDYRTEALLDELSVEQIAVCLEADPDNPRIIELAKSYRDNDSMDMGYQLTQYLREQCREACKEKALQAIKDEALWDVSP